MALAYLAVLVIGIFVIWLGFRIAEEVYQIAMLSTGAIAVLFGFFNSPDEVQLALEAVSLSGGLIKLRARF